jgi:hypothetical protein
MGEDGPKDEPKDEQQVTESRAKSIYSPFAQLVIAIMAVLYLSVVIVFFSKMVHGGDVWRPLKILFWAPINGWLLGWFFRLLPFGGGFSKEDRYGIFAGLSFAVAWIIFAIYEFEQFPDKPFNPFFFFEQIARNLNHTSKKPQ